MLRVTEDVLELRRWAQRRLARGETGLLEDAVPVFERTLIDVASVRKRRHIPALS